MNDEDIYAFHPVPGPDEAQAPPAPRRRRLWPWWLAAALCLLTAAAMLAGALALCSLAEAGGEGVHVVVNGQRWEALEGVGALAALGAATVALFGVGGALLLGLLVLLLVLPLTLGGVLLILALALAGALLALLLGLALGLLPLWLPLLLLWWLLRRKPAVAASISP